MMTMGHYFAPYRRTIRSKKYTLGPALMLGLAALIFNPIPSLSQKLGTAYKEEKYALLADSSEVTEYIFTEIATSFEGAVWANKGGLYGYIDSAGNEITPFRYDEANRFYSGLAVVARDSVYGAINRRGIEVIIPQYLRLMPFKQSISGAMVDTGEWILIDTLGIRISDLIFSAPPVYKESTFICVKRDEKWGVIDYTGRIIHPFEYDLIRPNGTAWKDEEKVILNIR